MAMAQVSNPWNGQALENAIHGLFTVFIKPQSILIHIQTRELLERKDIEEVQALTMNRGDSAGAELLLKKLCEKCLEIDWFPKFCEVLHHHDMKLQHVARMMNEQINECKSQRISVREQSHSSLYIKYNERMRTEILPIFTYYIVPCEVLPVLRKVTNRVLTRLDEENIKALAEKNGAMEGSRLLLERLILYEDWYTELLKALKELGAHHVITSIDEKTAETRTWYATEIENQQTYLKSTDHQRKQEQKEKNNPEYSMKEEHRNIIRNNYLILKEILSAGVETVCAYLYQSQIISLEMKDDILEVQTIARKRAEALLDLILTRGPHAFDELYRGCLEAEHYVAADILQPGSAPHQKVAGIERTLAQPMPAGHHSADGGHVNQQSSQEMSDSVNDDDSLESDGASTIKIKEHLQPSAVKSLSHSSSSPFSQKVAMQMLTDAKTVSDCGTVAPDTRLSDDLIRAAKSGDIGLLKSLIQNRADLNCRDSSGRTPLMICMLDNHVQCAMYLIEAGARVDLADKHGRTALIYAAKQGHALCLDPLLSCKLAVDNSGKTALIHAASSGHKDCVRQLLDAGCDVNKQDNLGNTALMYAAHGAHFECVEILCSHADVNIGNKKGVTALMLAAEKGCDQSLKLILEKNGNPNACRCDRRTALMYAAHKGHYGCVKLLTEKACDVNMSDNIGKTALMFATQRGDRQCVNLLIIPANLNMQDKDGCTALMVAVLYNHIEIVKLLVEAKAGVNITNNDNYTPLKAAEEKGYDECAKILRNAASS